MHDTKSTGVKMGRVRVNTRLRIYRLVKPLLKIMMKIKFNLEADLPAEVRELKPPYLILANHQGFWDAVSIGVNLPKPVSFIATDAIFRAPLFRKVLNIMGVIPKTKAISDMDTLKNVLRVKAAGGIIGIFPETRRTWDGTTLPLIYSVSKLVQKLKIPVVTAVIKGGYFSHPRWGVNLQRGKILVEYRLLMSGDQAGKYAPEDVHEKLIKALEHDEFAWQEKVKVRYRGKTLQNHLNWFFSYARHAASMEQWYQRENPSGANPADTRLSITGSGNLLTLKTMLFIKTSGTGAAGRGRNLPHSLKTFQTTIQ